MELLIGTGMLIIAALFIMFACNSLEPTLEYLGRNMSAGAKGALLMAVASSLPEIMVAFAFLFSGVPELILAGVFVTAGSAIFNICLIPALSILFAEDGEGNKVNTMKLDRKVLARDTFWLLTVEALFIYFLGMTTFTLTMAITLIAIYAVYVVHVIRDSVKEGAQPDTYDYEEIDHEENHVSISWLGKAMDFNKILFSNKEFTTTSALIVGGLSCIVIAIACHYLAEGTTLVSGALGIPVIIGAAVFAAAATSLPDTILSVGAAKGGEGDDAVANAVGSNIFDTSFAIGLPLLIALTPLGTWMFGFDLSEGIPLAHGDVFMDTVRYFVLGSSALAAAALMVKAHAVGKGAAYTLLAIYTSWVGYLIYMVS